MEDLSEVIAYLEDWKEELSAEVEECPEDLAPQLEQCEKAIEILEEAQK